LLLAGGLGGAVVGAFAEAGLRRAFQRPPHTSTAGMDRPADTGPLPRRRVLILGVLGGALLLIGTQALAGWLASADADPGQVWTHLLDCSTTPPDDRPLTEWLQSQSGVGTAAVTRDGKTVTVTYELPPDGAPLDIMKRAGELGYQWVRISAKVERK
jgi:hypothetical protein